MKTKSHRGHFLAFFILLWILFGSAQIFYFPSHNEAFAAQLKSVQSGTTTFPYNSTSVTATITSVDTTKAFLVFGVSENTWDPQYGQISGQITNSTTVTFQRYASIPTAGYDFTLKWYVAEFTSGVSVQRGSRSMVGVTTANVTLTSVDTTKSFPIISFRTSGTDYDNRHFVKAEITSNTNLELALQAAGQTSSVVEWQVVQFTDATVQSGDVSFLTTDASKTATITSVNTSKSWLIYTYNTASGTLANIGQKLVRGLITNATTLTFDRNNTGQTMNLTYYLVEFTDGTTVNYSSEDFTTSETEQNVTITAVDANKSIAAGGYFCRGGRSSYSTNDNAGVGWFTLDLTSNTNLRITRGTVGPTTPSTADVGWFVVQFSGCGFFYRKSITVQSDQVSGGPHTDFPMLVKVTDPDLKTLANGGKVASYDAGTNDPRDIIFRATDTTTCGGTAPCTLDHEIERYNPSTGELVAWARVPSITDGTAIYMYYGNICITSSTQNPSGVWNSNYKLVTHMIDNPDTSHVADSTINNNDGTKRGAGEPAVTTSGEIGDAQTYDGTNDRIDSGSATSIDDIFASGGTVEAWIYPTGWGETSYGRVADKSNATLGWRFYVNNIDVTAGLSFYHTANTNNTNPGQWDTPINSITLNQWQHVVVTFNNSSISNNPTVYINGASQTLTESKTPAGSYNSDATQNLVIGNRLAEDRTFAGRIDEFRISTTIRTGGWIATEYNNQGSPSTFYAVGTEQQAAPTAVTLKSFTATQYSEGVLLRWKTGFEVDNLGFHVYREENGQLLRLTPEPVAGSALLAGSRTPLTAGHHYHWWDASLSPEPSAISYQPTASKYWLEDIDLKGTNTMHGPVTPVFSQEPVPEKFRPELLSELGWRLQERYHHYRKVKEVREKLSQKRSVISYQPSVIKAASELKVGGRSSNLKPLRSDALTSRPKADLLVQQVLADRSAVKLFIREEGWYRVTQPELVAAGLNPRVKPGYLQLFVEGREQPIRVIGQKDGRFGPRDAIEFYGVGLDTPSTDTRVYWLVVGAKPGKRVEVSHSQGGQISSSSFLSTVERKDRVFYVPAIKNGDEENFFGPVISGGGVDQLLEVRHLDLAASEDAFLEVVLQGATNTSHRVKVLLNDDKEVGEVVFEGQSKGLLQVGVPQALLDEGENLVTFIAQGGEMDVSLVDSIRLAYWHTYTADDNALKFSASGGEHLSLSGFSNSRIRIFDITEPNDPIEVLGKVESQKGGYTVSFRVPGTEQRALLALAEEKVKTPEGITPNNPSSWHQSRNGYDLVITSHRDFLESLQPLKALRESQGLKVALVDVEDLYDEFSFGVKSPKAIKDFLASAKANWRRPPRFVLLVGDASLDPRNYLGFGDYDFVPTKLIDTQYLETASDDWFVDINNDGLPEIAVGRLPVRTAEEASIVVSKILTYERSTASSTALLVADMKEKSDDFDFEVASEEIRTLLPSSLMVRKIYRSQFSSDDQVKGILLSAINQGPLLVNFMGHGSIEIWRGIFASDDVENLTNRGLSFFVSMTCLNGYFQDPYNEPLAEALLKASQGGAVAVWTSSGMTDPDKQAVLNKELIRLLFNGELLTLGEATARAKSSVSDQDIRKTWILFGDPTTRLK